MASRGKSLNSFNVLYIEGNIFFDRQGRPHAVYRIPLRPYAHQSRERKLGVLDKLIEFFYTVQDKVTHGKLYSICREVSGEEYVRNHMELRQTGTTPIEFQRHNEAVKNKFQKRRPFNREGYLVVRMAKGKKSMPEINQEQGQVLDTLVDMGKYLVETVNEDFLGALGMDIPQEIFEQAVAMERELAGQIASTLDGKKVAPRDVEWLIRRNYFRALGEPELLIEKHSSRTIIEKGGRVYLRPHERATLSLTDECLVREKYNSLLVYHGEPRETKEISYQTFFAVANVPEGITLPGTEWLYWLNSQPFPTDVVVNFALQRAHSEQRKLEKKRRALKDQIREYREGGDELPIDVESASTRSKVLENKFSKGMPMIYTQTFIAVAGPDRETMEARASKIRQLYSPKNIKVVRSPGDMKKCFMAFVPGTETEPDWVLPVDPDYIAGSGILGTNQVGDPSGFYLAHLANGSPVLHNLCRPMAELNRSGAIADIGTLGGGKSVLKKDLAYSAVLLGGKVFSVDPKDEDHCFTRIPEFARVTKVLKFSAESDTRINPYNITSDFDRTKAIVSDYLSITLRSSGNEPRSLAVTSSIEKVMARPRKEWNLYTNMKAFEEVEKDYEQKDPEVSIQARRCAALLESYNKTAIGKLVFTEEQEQQDLAAYSIVVCSLKGLPLPKRNAGQDLNFVVTESERFGIGIMYLVACLGREMMLQSPKHMIKMFNIDEAWIMKLISEGERLIDEIVRMGRSYNIVPLLATQNPSDLPEDVRNNIGIYFFFRLEGQEAIDEAMKILGLNPEDTSLRQKMQNFESGHCFMKDIEGRVNIVKIDPQPGYLLSVFDTSPRGEAAEPNLEAAV